MTMSRLVSMVAAALMVAGAPIAASADSVTIDFSGTVSTAGAGYAVGTAYSGQFTYDTNAALISTGGNYKEYALATGAFTITIGGNTLTNASGGFPNNIEVSNSGQFEVAGNTMTGTGQLSGHSIFLSSSGRRISARRHSPRFFQPTSRRLNFAGTLAKVLQ
jgi:hypothetical protein